MDNNQMLKNTKISFLLPHVGATQLSYILMNNIHKYYQQNNHLVDFIIFYENMQKPCIMPPCTIMNIAELWSHSGISIATTYNTAQTLIKVAGPTRKILYLWDLEWKRHIYPYSILSSVYCNKDIDIICRSKSHYDLFKNMFNREPLGIVEDCNLDILGDILSWKN